MKALNYPPIHCHRLQKVQAKQKNEIISQVRSLNDDAAAGAAKQFVPVSDCHALFSDGVSAEIVEVMMVDSELFEPGVGSAKQRCDLFAVASLRINPEAPFKFVGSKPERSERYIVPVLLGFCFALFLI